VKGEGSRGEDGGENVYEKRPIISISSLEGREDCPGHLTEADTISSSLTPSGERDGVSVPEKFPLVTVLEPY
jgi:hypothetical protein